MYPGRSNCIYCNSNAILFSNKCYGSGDEEDYGSGSGSGPAYSDYSGRTLSKQSQRLIKRKLMIKKRLKKRRLSRNERCKKEALDRAKLLFKELGSGYDLGESDEDDSELDGPIDVESTVTSEK